jgi:hypothetical protein
VDNSAQGRPSVAIQLDLPSGLPEVDSCRELNRVGDVRAAYPRANLQKAPAAIVQPAQAFGVDQAAKVGRREGSDDLLVERRTARGPRRSGPGSVREANNLAPAPITSGGAP